MRVINIDLADITYHEIELVLQNLGLENKSDQKHFRYVHPRTGAEVLLAAATKEAVVYPPYIAGIATILEGFGLIADADALFQVIEKSRGSKTQPTA